VAPKLDVFDPAVCRKKELFRPCWQYHYGKRRSATRKCWVGHVGVSKKCKLVLPDYRAPSQDVAEFELKRSGRDSTKHQRKPARTPVQFEQPRGRLGRKLLDAEAVTVSDLKSTGEFKFSIE